MGFKPIFTASAIMGLIGVSLIYFAKYGWTDFEQTILSNMISWFLILTAGGWIMDLLKEARN